MLGTGWLWLARALYVAGAVSLAFAAWNFLSLSLAWLFFFFTSLAAFLTAAMVKKKSVAAPVHTHEAAGGTANALGATLPPAPMFDVEGRTPLERAFAEDEEGKRAGARRAV